MSAPIVRGLETAAALPEEQLNNFHGFRAGGALKRYAAGETLYVEAEAAPYCYEVVAGVLKEYNTLEDGRRQVAEFYSKGELFGISESPRHLHTAEAVTHCTVRSYPRDHYLQAVSASPLSAACFVATLMERVRRARERVIMIGRMSAMQRIAAFLARLSHDQAVTANIEIAMSRQDIADYLGLTIETVCRALTEMK
ncbi:MAG: cyclic nucleotide-binding domain-containing protein, partial [Hyphococcus sp.]